MPDRRAPSRWGRCRQQTLFPPWASLVLHPAHLHFLSPQRDARALDGEPSLLAQGPAPSLAQCGAGEPTRGRWAALRACPPLHCLQRGRGGNSHSGGRSTIGLDGLRYGLTHVHLWLLRRGLQIGHRSPQTFICAGGGLGCGLPTVSNGFLLRDLDTKIPNCIWIFFSLCKRHKK